MNDKDRITDILSAGWFVKDMDPADERSKTIDLLAYAIGALNEVLAECRTAITEQWDEDHPATIELVGKIDALLSPIADRRDG